MHAYVKDCSCYCGTTLQNLNDVALRYFKVIHSRICHLKGELCAWSILIVLTA